MVLGCWFVRALTCFGGRPHAEVLTLSWIARERARLVLVSLEPCSRFGKTPPCVYSILLRRVECLVLFALDRVQSFGLKLLRLFISLVLLWTARVCIKLAAKCVSTCFGQIGASVRMVLCSNSLSCLRLRANAICVSVSTLLLDNSVLLARAGASARIVVDGSRAHLLCNFIASYVCCVSALTCVHILAFRNARLVCVNRIGRGLCVCEFGCLMSRFVLGVMWVVLTLPLFEGAFVGYGWLMLNKRQFLREFVCLNV
ncbi:hypothetical protein AADW59_00040 [Candidatus Hodgkinia cicadicola]